MAMTFRLIFPMSCLIAFIGTFLAWLGVPNEQAFPMNYPNVMFISHTSDPVSLVPVRTDNVTLGAITTQHLGGLYQHELFFYHDRMATFEKFANGGVYRVWECIMFCQPELPYPSRLYLMHRAPSPDEGKKGQHTWYLVEMKERDKETPVIYARMKYRKTLQIDAPWVEPDPSRSTPKLLPITMFSIWDVLKPNRSEVIAGWLVVLGGLFGFIYMACKDDGEDF